MSLTSLSNELLLQIIEHIELSLYKSDRSTLFKLLLCSKFFSALVRPRLYASVLFESRHFERLHGFAHAVLRSPENALYVRHFAIEFDIAHDELNYRPERRLAPSAGLDFDYLEPAVRRYSQSETDTAKWMDDLHKGVQDALLVLVLPALVRLEHFEFSAPRGAVYYEKMLVRLRNSSRGSDSFLCFNSLTTLTVFWCDTENGPEFNKLRPFFIIPSMRRLNGTSTVDARSSNHNDDSMNALLPPQSSRITDVRLNTSSLSPADIEEIFQVCECIKTFRYQHTAVAIQQFSPAGIARASVAAKYDLEELFVASDDIHFRLNGVPEEHILIGSLKDYTALRSIRTHPSILLGWRRPPTVHLIEVLPRSLESLDLIGCVDHEEVMVVLAEIETIIAEKASRFPRLSKIFCEGPFTKAAYFNNNPLKYSSVIGRPPPEHVLRATRVLIPYDFASLRLLAKAEDVSIEVREMEYRQPAGKKIELGTYVDSVLAESLATNRI